MASKKDLFKNSANMLSSKVSKIDKSTKEALNIVENNPTQEYVDNAIKLIEKDRYLSVNEKDEILEEIKNRFINVFSFDNCPDDYEALKVEAKFLSGISQYSFLLMAQRLKKIRDKNLYVEDGYNDFKEFIETELNVSRRTAYNYIELIECFGVQALAHDNIDTSKLIPTLPILNSDNKAIPKEELKYKFIEDSKNKTFRELQEETRELKIRYGIGSKKTNKTEFEKLLEKILKSLPDHPNDNEKEMIREVVSLFTQKID